MSFHDRLGNFRALVERLGDAEAFSDAVNGTVRSTDGTGDRLPELNESTFFLFNETSEGGVIGSLETLDSCRGVVGVARRNLPMGWEKLVSEPNRTLSKLVPDAVGGRDQSVGTSEVGPSLGND